MGKKKDSEGILRGWPGSRMHRSTLHRSCRPWLAGLLLLLCACQVQQSPEDATPRAAEEVAPSREVVRVATFNIWELSRQKLDQLDDAGLGDHPQLRRAAEVIQRVRPRILLLNEIDFDPDVRHAELFVERYLRVSQGGQKPIDYPYIFAAPVNTGLPTGLDLNRDGKSDGPDDAYGFGRYPGQYGMALLSQLPIDIGGVRSFRLLPWQQMPGHLIPDGQDGRPAWYEPATVAELRLSSKSHWDVPVQIGDGVLHILASHPTPPVFDGEEDRNGRRNFDEIRLWADYLSGGDAASYLVDDAGVGGGLPADASFVILGDLNADRFGDQGAPYGRPAIDQLLVHPRVQDVEPRGGGVLAEERAYAGPKALRTSPYGRLDYVLPSRDLDVQDAGVFWPEPDDPLYALISGSERASDHALVWVNLAR